MQQSRDNARPARRKRSSSSSKITQSSLASPDLPTDRVTAHVTTTAVHVTTTCDHVTDHMTTSPGDVTISQSISCSNTQKYKENELLKQSGTLVRKNLQDPHSPIWLSDCMYPAQYVVRQTRSMTALQQHQDLDKRQDSLSLIVSIPLLFVTIQQARPLLKQPESHQNETTQQLPALPYPILPSRSQRLQKDLFCTQRAAIDTNACAGWSTINKEGMVSVVEIILDTAGKCQPGTFRYLGNNRLSRGNCRILEHRSLIGAFYDTSKRSLRVATLDHTSHVCVLCFSFKAPVLHDSWNIPEGQTDFLLTCIVGGGIAAATCTLSSCGNILCRFDYEGQPPKITRLSMGQVDENNHRITTALMWSTGNHCHIACALADYVEGVTNSLILWNIDLELQSEDSHPPRSRLPIPSSSSLSSLCQMERAAPFSTMLIGSDGFKIFLWDLTSSALLKCVSLNCCDYIGEEPSLSHQHQQQALVLRAIWEMDHVFIVIGVREENTLNCTSRCWLVEFELTERDHNENECRLVLSYSLPGIDVVTYRGESSSKQRKKEQSTLSPIQSRDCVSPASHCYSSVPGSSELAALVHDGTYSYIAVWDLTDPVPQSLFKITGMTVDWFYWSHDCNILILADKDDQLVHYFHFSRC